MTIAVVDGDIVAYRCAASCEPNKSGKTEREPLELAISRCDELMYRILDTVGADEYKVFLSGSRNFRKEIYPEYKANRENIPKPMWLEQIKEFLITEWDAKVTDGYEADDAIAMFAANHRDVVICSIDKDLKQIPGDHYNFVYELFENVDEDLAQYYFWYLMLVGDASDNVKGVQGIGPKKAEKLLKSTPQHEWYDVVKSAYNDDERFELNLKLFTLLKESNDSTEPETERKIAPEFSSKEDLDGFSTINS